MSILQSLLSVQCKKIENVLRIDQPSCPWCDIAEPLRQTTLQETQKALDNLRAAFAVERIEIQTGKHAILVVVPITDDNQGESWSECLESSALYESCQLCPEFQGIVWLPLR